MVFNFNLHSILESKEADFDKVIKLSQMNTNRGASAGEEANAISLAKQLVKKNNFTREDFKGKIDDAILISIFGKLKPSAKKEHPFERDERQYQEDKSKKKDFIDLVDDEGKKVSLRKIKLNFGDKNGGMLDVLIEDEYDLFDQFINSPFYTFMDWGNNGMPTRTTNSRIDIVHTSWFEPADKGALSAWFFEKITGKTIGGFALFPTKWRYDGKNFTFKTPPYPILFIVPEKIAGNYM